MTARWGRFKRIVQKHVDPWVARIADYWGAGVALVAAIGLVVVAASKLRDRFGSAQVSGGAVVAILLLTIMVLAWLLRKERAVKGLPVAPEPDAPPPAHPSTAPSPPQPESPPLRPQSKRPAVRPTPAFREAFGDHAFGELLQLLYNEGHKLEKGCRTSFELMSMGTLLGGKPTDDTDVRAWVHRVDEALRGRAKLRAKFAASGEAPAVLSVFSVSAMAAPLKDEMRRRLDVLAVIIESL